MLCAKPITRDTKELPEIMRLYSAAFPKEERVSLDFLLNPDDAVDFCAVYDDGVFCGFFSILNNRDISHITFLAVEETMRGKGVGSEILKLIREGKPGQRILADLESVEEIAENHEQREKRMNFYLRNGYKRTDVAYRWRGVEYQILSQGGNVTDEEFGRFWEELDRRKGIREDNP